jgi:hypothetical protein
MSGARQLGPARAIGDPWARGRAANHSRVTLRVVRADTYPSRPVRFIVGFKADRAAEKSRIGLTRIEPDKPGFARLSFECPRCQRQMTEVIELKTAA